VHNGLQIEHIARAKGPPVLLLHSSASSNRQWRKLIALLSSRLRVIAPNLRGYGATTAWHGAHVQTLDDAAEVVMALCESLALQGPLRLGGAFVRRCGGAALRARTRPSRVASGVARPMLPGLRQATGAARRPPRPPRCTPMCSS